MSLYRKYRPQSFAHLVGQDHIKETLLNELKHGHATHAYLFAGPRGTGKTSAARLIAKCLNCPEKTEEGEACEKCDFCKDITDGRLIDVIEIDAASNRGIDEIRDLREKIKFAPTRAKNKIYIIDEVHMLTKDAFNALLKTLEEPPPNVYFILCTTEIHKILETIISRCQRFDFKRIDVKTIMTRLNYIAQKEKFVVEDGAIEIIAHYVEGGLRDAIALLEQMVFDGKLTVSHLKEHLGVTGHHTISQIVYAFMEKDLQKALHLIAGVHNEGYDLSIFHRELLDSLRTKLLQSIETENEKETAEFSRMIEILLRAREEFRFSPLPQLPLELASVQICSMNYAAQSEQTPAEKAARKTEAKTETKTEAKHVKDENILQKIIGEKSSEASDGEKETAKQLKESADKKSWDLETVRQHWKEILEKVRTPSVRRSLQTGRVADVDKRTVTIAFDSQFHLDKVNLVENKDAIEEAFASVFEKKPVAQFALDKADHAERKPRELKKKEIAEHAMEIFGGEEL